MAAKFSVAVISIFFLAGCSGSILVSERHEREELRELALHRYDEGSRFAEAGNTELAMERFNRSVEIRPSPAGYFQVAQTQRRLGDDFAAAPAYAKALQLAPDYQEARLALMELGYTPPDDAAVQADEDALEQFAKQVEVESEARKVEAAKGKKLTEEQKKALRDRIRARETGSAEHRIPTAAEVRAALFPATVSTEEVMPSATDPTYANDRSIILNTYPYHFSNALRLQKNREFEKAAEEYQLAITLDAAQMDARLNLGDCMLRLERFPQALFHYTRALEQFPDSPKPLLKMGNYNEAIKRTDAARDFYGKARDKDPKYIEPYNNLAAIEIREKNYDKAVELLNQAIQIDPGYSLAYLNLGIAQERKRDKAAALAAYRKYVDLGGEQAAEVRKWIAEME